MVAMMLLAAASPNLAVPASAQQTAPIVTLYGAAGTTCQTWLSEPPNGPDHQAHMQWLLGYVSGYNMSVANNEALAIDGNDGVTGWLDARYCQFHPDDAIATAAARFIDEARSRLGYPLLRYSPPALRYSN